MNRIRPASRGYRMVRCAAQLDEKRADSGCFALRDCLTNSKSVGASLAATVVVAKTLPVRSPRATPLRENANEMNLLVIFEVIIMLIPLSGII